jgi:lantibiotic biosynthesis protein
VRRYEIVLGASPGVAPSRRIARNELMVGVRAGHFYLRWPAAGKDVVVSAGHMLNNMNAPAVARFLTDASREGDAVLSTFEWGPAEEFPFLPRVRVGRVVLRPAQWRVALRELWAERPEQFHEAVERWRTRWGVPRRVCLSMADNRLILDLEDAMQREELRTELSTLHESGYVLLQELLPSLDEVWTQGPDGRYLTEFVVSLVLREGAVQVDSVNTVTPLPGTPEIQTSMPLPRTIATAITEQASVRLRPPGSDWLFAKLYTSRSLEEDLVAGSLRNFADYMLSEGFADDWFFIRYSDPDPHIRLRFRGTAGQLSEQLLPRLCAWGGRAHEERALPALQSRHVRARDRALRRS